MLARAKGDPEAGKPKGRGKAKSEKKEPEKAAEKAEPEKAETAPEKAEPANSPAAPGPQLTGFHKETFDALAPALKRQVARETEPHRQAQAAMSLIDGEPPAVQKELARVLREMAPEAYERIRTRKGAPFAGDAFKEPATLAAKPEADTPYKPAPPDGTWRGAAHRTPEHDAAAQKEWKKAKDAIDKAQEEQRKIKAPPSGPTAATRQRHDELQAAIDENRKKVKEAEKYGGLPKAPAPKPAAGGALPCLASHSATLPAFHSSASSFRRWGFGILPHSSSSHSSTPGTSFG
jgi:hypothetical protein